MLKEHGFSAFGSGLDKAHAMGVAAWTILRPKLRRLMTSDGRFQLMIEKVDREDGTFQKFCHLLFTTLIPIFDRKKHITSPTWIECGSDINTFALRLDTYLRVLKLRRSTYGEDNNVYDRSGMFLNTVGKHVHQYRGYISILQEKIKSHEKRRDPLPDNLTILGLAENLTARHTSDCITWENNTAESSGRLTDSHPSAYCTSGYDTSCTVDLDNIPVIHHNDQLDYLDNDIFFASLQCCRCHSDTGDLIMQGHSNRTFAPQRPPNTTTSRRLSPRVTLRVPHPNIHSHRPPRPTVKCADCGKLGHEAAQCDFLAMMVTMERWKRQGRHQSGIDDALRRWNLRYEKYLDRRRKGPVEVKELFLRDNGLTD